jgi:predicted enzyme related to lactoylglutathione lyase
MNFNSLLIGSENPDGLVEYYSKLLGAPAFSMGGYTGWQLGSGFVTIGPHSEVHGSNLEPGRIIWNIETPNVRGEFERMKAAGAIVIREPYEFSGDGAGESPDQSETIATLADPDGNYFQLAAPMPMDEPAGS